MRFIALMVVTVSLFGCTTAASFTQTHGVNGALNTRAYVNTGAALKYDPVTGYVCLDARNIGGDSLCETAASGQ